MYSIGSASIKLDHALSRSFDLKIGVRQGDNLSSALFNIVVNDIPAYSSGTKDPVHLDKKSINCLMYADDIVILSSTPEGLQQKLNHLEQYCRDWCLTVNTRKTKVLVFNKAGRLHNIPIKFDNTNIECVSNYKYLGINFTASGSFSMAKNVLCNKAKKAYFKLRKDLLSLNPDIVTSLHVIHVFDHTKKPILLCGSEIWRSLNTLSNTFKRKKQHIDKLYEKLPCENSHIKFCKGILGVHKGSSNFGVLSELGRSPLYKDIIQKTLNIGTD